MNEVTFKQMGLKMGIVFLMAASFALLFQIQATVMNMLIVSAILAVVNTAAEQWILKSKEPVITHLYALFIFILNIVILNWYTYVLFGRGMNSQMATFYFSIALTIFITIYDFYKPKKN